MKLAYLTTAYPEVSHTFIRREIHELERRGHDVLRVAVRRHSSTLVDPRDLAEEPRTLRLLDDKPGLVGAVVLEALRAPLGFARALATALRLSRRSDRGLVRHLAYLAEACGLRRILARAGVEHVHVHFGTNAAAVALLARTLGGPRYSLTVHGPDEFDAPVGLSLADKVAASEFTVAISSFGAAQLRRWVAREHWHKLAIVRCTLGEDFGEPAGPIPAQSRSFVCVGRLSAQKGHLLLLEAFAELLRRGADARLVLAGDGEMRAEIEAALERLGLRERVAITGWVDAEKIRELVRESRALVLPSFAEGLPVVILETFALGRPVIASCIAGVPEIVEDGASGWLVPAGSVEPLVAALETALAAPTAQLDAMGARGRARALAQHGTRTEVAKLDALFARAARGGER